MPKPDEHLQQAKKNLKILQGINSHIDESFDWQVTVCFYSALHLINFHLVTCRNLQFRSHTQVKNALNPYASASPAKLPEDEYYAYEALRAMSRRSRYLVSEKGNGLESGVGAFTYEKHLGRALRHLDKLLKYFNEKYLIEFEKIELKCAVIKPSDNLAFFTIHN